MKGEVIVPDGGIKTIDVFTRTYEKDTQVFAARVYVEHYPACTIPFTYGDKVSLMARDALFRIGLLSTRGRVLDAYCAANGIVISYHVLEVATLDEVREWGTPGWEDDIRWHKGHEFIYERIVKTRWPVDSRTTVMNIRTAEGKQIIEQDLLFCETCNAVVQGVTLERTKELDLIINRRSKDLLKTYKGAAT